jgi:hypothetical protein
MDLPEVRPLLPPEVAQFPSPGAQILINYIVFSYFYMLFQPHCFKVLQIAVGYRLAEAYSIFIVFPVLFSK